MADAESRDRDLDETRRLLYMALVAGKTKRYNLAGTLINALRHHQGVADADLEAQVLALMDDGTADEAWARAQITRITDELNAGGA